jgi:hypothetical protein
LRARALPARHLERAARHLSRRLRGRDLRLHDRDERRRVAGLAEARGLAHEQARSAYRDVHVGDGVLDHLDLGERAAVGVGAVLRVLGRCLRGGRGDPHVHRGEPDQEEGRDRREHELRGAARRADASGVLDHDVIELHAHARVAGHPEPLPGVQRLSRKRAVLVHARRVGPRGASGHGSHLGQNGRQVVLHGGDFLSMGRVDEPLDPAANMSGAQRRFIDPPPLESDTRAAANRTQAQAQAPGQSAASMA